MNGVIVPVKSILMVCRGNICRSPMAEGFFRHHLQMHHSPIIVNSAGISDLSGNPADPNAIAIMNANNIDITNHVACQINDRLVLKADLILVMTLSQLNAVKHQFVSARGKTFLLGHWHNVEIQDPYMQSVNAFENVYQQIEHSWQEWKSRILACQNIRV